MIDEEESDTSKFKISFLGPKTGGKTCIITRFHNNNFSTQVDSTIGVSFLSHTIQTSKTKITLHIWDTAGEERYRCIIPMYFRGSAALVVVFDVSSQPNFEQAKEWFKIILDEENEVFDLYFVGNKIDLPRRVSKKDAIDFAKSVNATYIETSAKTGEKINDLFLMIAEKIVQREDLSLAIPRSLTIDDRKGGCCK
ncbi:GTP-binding protein of the rab [Tritrichomonas musculus]|uniref:GTP-binding protein of the rab n=1 Tax=Tritrichomonas musculus TaxID=1915356 RepID=A0ABR2HGY9_9EUKA